MNMQNGRGTGALGAVPKRPLIFLLLAVMIFAGALFTARVLIEPPSVEAKMHIDIIELDIDAGDTDSLMRRVSLDADGLKSALLEDALPDAENTANRLLGATWHDHLMIRAGGTDGEFIIELGGDKALQETETINGLLQTFADQENRRRTEQKAETAFWIEQQRTAWQARIDEAKAAIVQNPFDPALPRGHGRSGSANLLRLMIDATTEARTAQKTNNPESEADNDGRDLAAETTRLTAALRKNEVGRAAQLHHGKLLKEAEARLAQLQEDARDLMREGGILDRPAATILMPPILQVTNPLQHFRPAGWHIILATLAVASLILALVGTLIIGRPRSPVEVTSGDPLNDPHWPLPPDAHRDLSS